MITLSRSDAPHFLAVVFIIVGTYITFFGYSRNPRRTTARHWMRKCNQFSIGFALGSLIVLQLAFYVLNQNSEKVLWIIWILVPVGCAIIVTVFELIGLMWTSIYLFFIVGEMIAISINNQFPVFLTEQLTIASIGFTGAIATVLLSLNGFGSFVMYITCSCGMIFLLEGISCFVPWVPSMRPFDFSSEQTDYCTSSVKDVASIRILAAIVFGGAFLGCFSQLNIARIIRNITKKKNDEGKKSSDSELNEPLLNEKIKTRQKWQKTIHERDPRNSYRSASLREFVHFSANSLPYAQEQRRLQKRIRKLGFQERILKCKNLFRDSQFSAIADQLNMFEPIQLIPTEDSQEMKDQQQEPYQTEQEGMNENQASSFSAEFVRKEISRWLQVDSNWNQLIQYDNDVFGLEGIDRFDYIKRIDENAPGDFITLQAAVQLFKVPIKVISSIPGNKYEIEFQVFDPNEKWLTLISSDEEEIPINKAVAMRSSTLSYLIKEAEEENNDRISFRESPFLTGPVLRTICNQLKGPHVFERTVGDLQKAIEYFDLVGYVARSFSEGNSEHLYLSHYWGYHYGSLMFSCDKLGSSELDDTSPYMRAWSRPYGRMAINRIIQILTNLAGLWWLMWILIFGNEFPNFLVGVEYLMFLLAELINFSLGIIYNLNFWYPIERRWKSLDKLQPEFVKNLIVNCLICHYTEDPMDTARTLNGVLRMKTLRETTLRIYVCDDGFFINSNSGGKKNPQSRISKFFRRLWASVRRNNNLPETIATNPSNQKLYLPSYPGEDITLQYIRAHFNNEPRPKKSEKMLNVIEETLFKYCVERLHIFPKIHCEISLKTIHCDAVRGHGDILRTDCAVASLCYRFIAKDSNDKMIAPEVFLIARVKPKVHHNKAGNINNCIYNEQLEGEYILFFDNDMRPKSKFLMRTLPWFFSFNEHKQDYYVNKGIAFVQVPQYFKSTTIASGNHDFLSSRNSIFFQAIQNGRDGFDMCAFAGTNAIFRLAAIKTVGGMPYGSMTEDAFLSIKLHKYGYRSIYIEDRLAVGLAPVTVANTMQQRRRWVKGSVQIFLLSISCGPEEELQQFKKGYCPLVESRREIEPYSIPASQRVRHEFFRRIFALDTMMYPFSAMSAIFYMVAAFFFLLTGVPPINFQNGGFNYQSFLFTFLPFYILKFISNFLAYNRVRTDDVWVAQEVWFSYSFAALLGIIDAFKEEITGSGLVGWGVTGSGMRTGKLEWVNVIVLMILSISLVIRFLLYLLTGGELAELAGVFFGAIIVAQMWPIVSTTLYEWAFNSHLPDDEKSDLKRIEIPNYILFTLVLIIGILLSLYI